MNLLPENTQVTATDIGSAYSTIARIAESGVRLALSGEFEKSHIAQIYLTGIWQCFTNHPLGYLAERAQLLISAATYHKLGEPYYISKLGKELANLPTGEAA